MCKNAQFNLRKVCEKERKSSALVQDLPTMPLLVAAHASAPTTHLSIRANPHPSVRVLGQQGHWHPVSANPSDPSAFCEASNTSRGAALIPPFILSIRIAERAYCVPGCVPGCAGDQTCNSPFARGAPSAGGGECGR